MPRLKKNGSKGMHSGTKKKNNTEESTRTGSNILEIFTNNSSQKNSESVSCRRRDILGKGNRHADKRAGQNQRSVVIEESRKVVVPVEKEKRKCSDIIVIDDDSDEDNDKFHNNVKEASRIGGSSRMNFENFNTILRSILLKASGKMDERLLIFRRSFNPFRCKNIFKGLAESKGLCCNFQATKHGYQESDRSESKLVTDDDSNDIPFDNCNESVTCDRTDKRTKFSLMGSSSCEDNTKEVTESCSSITEGHSSLQLETDSNAQDKITEKNFEPYYWDNFNFVIDSVLEDETNTNLFNCEDVLIIKKFRSISQLAQQLYVRLFLRKYVWFKIDKIKYPKIGEDLGPMIKELICSDLLDDKSSLDDLSQVLNLMSAPEVRSLAQFYHLLKDCEGRKLTTKEDLILAILHHGKNQKSVKSFFMKSSSATDIMKKAMIKKSKSVLGDCVKVSQRPREVFCRIFSLFTYMNSYLYEEGNTRSNLIYRILQIKKGELIFPPYKIAKSVAIFKSREGLIKYAEAIEAEEEFFLAMDEKDFDKALKIYQKAKREVDSICLQLKSIDGGKVWSTEIPLHLRKFSPEWIYFRICCKSVEALEKKGDYCQAVDLVRQILLQDKYCLRSRGALWERLVIDTERYLKDSSEALEYIKTAIEDPWVRTGARMGLLQRAKRICGASKNKHLKERRSEFEAEQLEDVIEVTISAPVFLDTSSSHRTIFLLNGGGEAGMQEYSAVEEYALSHYREAGYPNGVHGEGSPYLFIFSLLFWEIIFMDFDDAFHGPFQGCPLDFSTDNFYEARKKQIDVKLEKLRNSTKQELAVSVEDSWMKHEGQVCVASNWSLFDSPQQLMDLVTCLGTQAIAGICEIFCKDYRNRSSGMPDLLVWNPVTQKCRAVEVKGPGDRLSNRQIIWLNVLTSLGMDAEVCYVKGVGGKRRRLSKD